MSSANGGCPCGGVHPGPSRKRVWRKPSAELPARVAKAQWAGKSQPGEFHSIDWAGDDCDGDVWVNQHSHKPRLTVRQRFRCRKCGKCRRAMRNYWGYAAMQQTLLSAAEGGRTWFGTLTCDADWQAELLLRAMKRSKEPSAPWWKVENCEERYRRVCAEFLREVQKYWKRLRNDGHSFKYLAVFEPHKSGKPHCHFLLHELQGDTILKRELRDRWPCGFIGATLVGGTARQAADPNKAAWYAVKYLSKHNQTRVRASRNYVPDKRAKPHSPQDVNNTNFSLERSEKEKC